MSWFSSVITALVTAAIGTVVSGYFANLSVRWYRISSFEGGSGYYVVGLALCGLVAGLVIGLVVSRIVAASAHPGMLLALLYSAVLTVGIATLSGGAARLLADIPPTLDDEQLMLQLDVRWPAARADSPANTPGVAYLDLGAATVLRKADASRGAFWKQDARKIDGQWTVTGAAPLLTSRGTPVVNVTLNESEHLSFRLPKMPHPTAQDSVWSKWSSAGEQTGSSTAAPVTYRYRVQKKSAPVRTEHVGDFDVSASVSYFVPSNAVGLSTIDFYGSFHITWRGQPLSASSAAAGNTSDGAAEVVAVLPGVRPALLAAVSRGDSGTAWTLLSDEDGTRHTQRVARYVSHEVPEELTNSAERMAETRKPNEFRGHVDHTRFARSKMLLFEDAVLNVETRAVYPFTAKAQVSLIPSVPPLGVSPDAHSFVRYAVSMGAGPDNTYAPRLVVTDFVRDTVYEVLFNRARISDAVLDRIGVDWLDEYFVWKRDASGIDKLEVRPEFR